MNFKIHIHNAFSTCVPHIVHTVMLCLCVCMCVWYAGIGAVVETKRDLWNHLMAMWRCACIGCNKDNRHAQNEGRVPAGQSAPRGARHGHPATSQHRPALRNTQGARADYLSILSPFRSSCLRYCLLAATNNVGWSDVTESMATIRPPFCGYTCTRTMAKCVELMGKDLSCCFNKIQSVGLWKCPCDH